MSQLSLANLLLPDRIKIPVEAEDKHGVIEEMCGFLSDLIEASEEERQAIQVAVLEREAVLSTGIGGNVAIPHGKSEALSELVLVAGRTAGPIDFDAIDERPVRLLLLLVGPESAADQHVRVLSRIGRVMRNAALRQELIDAPSPEAFHGVIAAAEAL